MGLKYTEIQLLQILGVTGPSVSPWRASRPEPVDGGLRTGNAINNLYGSS